MLRKELIILAEFMHTHKCHIEHVERCGWDYEINSIRGIEAGWKMPEHKKWFEIAKKIMVKLSRAEQLGLMQKIRTYRKLHNELQSTYKVI